MRDTKNYLSLPFNPKLRERARELRHTGNLCEVLLWQQLHHGKLNGLDFDRQKIIGDYIVDFYCAECRVVIEIDGGSHNEKGEYDEERNKFLEKQGLTVIHILAKDVLYHLGSVMTTLETTPALRATPPREGN